MVDVKVFRTFSVLRLIGKKRRCVTIRAFPAT
jgi:hypothetical protein